MLQSCAYSKILRVPLSLVDPFLPLPFVVQNMVRAIRPNQRPASVRSEPMSVGRQAAFVLLQKGLDFIQKENKIHTHSQQHVESSSVPSHLASLWLKSLFLNIVLSTKNCLRIRWVVEVSLFYFLSNVFFSALAANPSASKVSTLNKYLQEGDAGSKMYMQLKAEHVLYSSNTRFTSIESKFNFKY
jgi:hypothetical protein